MFECSTPIMSRIDVSRHNGGPIQPLKPPNTIVLWWLERPSIAPIWCRETRISQTALRLIAVVFLLVWTSGWVPTVIWTGIFHWPFGRLAPLGIMRDNWGKRSIEVNTQLNTQGVRADFGNENTTFFLTNNLAHFLDL